jgi:hypothetical protein
VNFEVVEMNDKMYLLIHTAPSLFFLPDTSPYFLSLIFMLFSMSFMDGKEQARTEPTLPVAKTPKP